MSFLPGATNRFELMVLVSRLNREAVIRAYLERERRDKGTAVPADVDDLAWDDSGVLNAWLRDHGYKEGVLSDFRSWVRVRLTESDLLDCVIAGFAGFWADCPSRRIGTLLTSGRSRAQEWGPDRPTSWFNALDSGARFPQDAPLILRPSVPSEGGRWYIEDGSGRGLCYARRLRSHPGKCEAVGYLALDPDPQSGWLRRNLDNGHFIDHAGAYHEPRLV